MIFNLHEATMKQCDISIIFEKRTLLMQNADKYRRKTETASVLFEYSPMCFQLENISVTTTKIF